MIRLDWDILAWNLAAYALCVIAWLAFVCHPAFYTLPPNFSLISKTDILSLFIYGGAVWLFLKLIFISFNKGRMIRRDV